MTANSLHGEAPSQRFEQSVTAPTAHGTEAASQNRPLGPQIKPSARLEPRLPVPPRILIVSNDDTLAKELALICRQAGLPAERVTDIAEGCESARTGRFPVVMTTPHLKDGSWKQLASIARDSRLGFAIILVAKVFDTREWAQALEDGAFEVLDELYELPKAAEAVRRALWTECLTGAWPNLQIPDSQRIS